MRKIIYLLLLLPLIFGCSDEMDEKDDEKIIIPTAEFKLGANKNWKQAFDLNLETLYQVNSIAELDALTDKPNNALSIDIDFEKETLLFVRILTGKLKSTNIQLMLDSNKKHTHQVTLEHYPEGTNIEDIGIIRNFAVKTAKISPNSVIELSIIEK